MEEFDTLWNEESSRSLCAGQTLFWLWPLQQIDLSEQLCLRCNCNWTLVPFCCGFVLLNFFFVAASLKQTLACQLQSLFYKRIWTKSCLSHRFLNFIEKEKKSVILVESAGWDHWVKYKNGKCLQIGVMSCLIFAM